MPRPRQSKTLPIGATCLWYPNADRNAGKRAAIVTGPDRPNDQGVLNLAAFPDQTASILPVKGCRHVDDPYLKDHPQMARSRGGWDYSESMPVPDLQKKQAD